MSTPNNVNAKNKFTVVINYSGGVRFPMVNPVLNAVLILDYTNFETHIDFFLLFICTTYHWLYTC